MNAGCQQFFCENYYLTKTKFWCFKVTSICCFWTKPISHLKSYTSIINGAPSENDIKVKLLKQPMKNCESVQNQAYICQLCKICLNLKKTQKNTNKQTKKKSVTGTFETINKKLVSCLADLLPLKGVRHFEGILQIIITSKLQIQCEKGAHFSFDFGWYSSILILPVKNIQGHGGGVFT